MDSRRHSSFARNALTGSSDERLNRTGLLQQPRRPETSHGYPIRSRGYSTGTRNSFILPSPLSAQMTGAKFGGELRGT